MEHLGYFVKVSDTEVRFQLEKPAEVNKLIIDWVTAK